MNNAYDAQSIYDKIDTIVDRIHFISDAVYSYLKMSSEEGFSGERSVTFGSHAQDVLDEACSHLMEIAEEICPHTEG